MCLRLLCIDPPRYLKTSGSDAQVCCSGSLVAKKDSHMCCKGKYVAAQKGEICCDGSVGEGDKCCGTTPFASSGLAPKMCCGGKLYDALNGQYPLLHVGLGLPLYHLCSVSGSGSGWNRILAQ